MEDPAYFMSNVILWERLKSRHISCTLWMFTGTLHINSFSLELGSRHISCTLWMFTGTLQINSFSLELGSSPTQLIFEAGLNHKPFVCHSFTCNPDRLRCIMSRLLTAGNSSWVILSIHGNVYFWRLVAMLNINVLEPFNLLSHVPVIEIFHSLWYYFWCPLHTTSSWRWHIHIWHPLFPNGVSCRSIPRPVLGAPGLCPGLLLMISLCSLNSGVWNSHLTHLRVNLQQTPHFLSFAITICGISHYELSCR